MKQIAITLIGLGIISAPVFAAETLSTSGTSMQVTSPSQSNVVATNQTAGEAFLTTNKAKPGVVVLPSGLQYQVLVKGSGVSPKDGDTVTVDYAGTLVNGTEFDSSYKRGQPATFPVNGVIAGWTEALKLMRPGAEWELYIPASLAYGEAGAPPAIGPNETLIFKVKLISVN